MYELHQFFLLLSILFTLLTKNMAKLATIFIFLCTFATFSHCLPLSTSSRWIIDDENGQRVKLACVNWAAHLQTMLPEGLDQQPINNIVKQISLMGFNIVFVLHGLLICSLVIQISLWPNLLLTMGFMMLN